MMRTLNILHISDAHIQKKDEEEIKEIVEKLIEDVIKVQNQEEIKIDLICFTGDLIQRGDKAANDENQWSLAQSILVEPLLKQLGLTKNEYIMVPGNHEVDITKILRVTEKGLMVNSLEDINNNMSDMHESYLDRLAYFYNNIKSDHKDIIIDKIGYAFIKNIKNMRIGIACIDSAWRSSGKGKIERDILYVGEKQVRDLYKHIKDADIKICLMHHTTDWLSIYERNLIEQQLNKFDIVLCGHVHENDTKVIIRNEMNTVYSIAGKLYPIDFSLGKRVDGYNGYSILNINLDESLCTIFLRLYYAKERQEFDAAIELNAKGKVVYPLNENFEDIKMEYGIIKGIESFYLKMSETLSLINEIDSVSPINICSVYIDPILSDRSEYEKIDIEKVNYINFKEIISEEKNYIIIGKKESGKTTILQNIGLEYVHNHANKRIIPIYIDMRSLPKKGDVIIKSIVHFISDYSMNSTKISKEKIEELINNGKCIFLIDNVDINNDYQTNILNTFLRSHNNNKYILTVQEQFFQALDIKKIPDYGANFEKVFIGSLRKNQVRELVTKWLTDKKYTKDIGKVVEKINNYCNKINLAKTPFNISIFLVLWDFNRNFVPQNEAYVMDNYLEIVLEKLSINEGNRSTYAYPIKQDFMSKVAFSMFEKNQYYFTQTEFKNFVDEYHMIKGYKVEDTKFDTLFFEKNILCYSGDYIFFSHTSVLEYYLALYAKNNKQFLDYMTKKGNRTNFQNEICFYSGLTPDCKNLLDEMAKTIKDEISKDINTIDKLNNIEIISDFKLNKEELYQKVYENRPTQDEIDELCDYPVQEIEPLNLDKKRGSESYEDDTEDFLSLIQMYGSVLKNAELLDNTDKIHHLENYMCAMNIILVKLLEIAKISYNDFNIDELFEITKKDNLLTPEELETAKTQAYDIFQIAFPMGIQQFISENVGTPKLELAIDKLMENKQDKPFEKFMLIFLKCDLGIGNIKSNLSSYIRQESSPSILKIIQIKLIYYIHMRFVGVDKKTEEELLDLIFEINFKLYPEDAASQRKAYKSNKTFLQKALLSKIRKL